MPVMDTGHQIVVCRSMPHYKLINSKNIAARVSIVPWTMRLWSYASKCYFQQQVYKRSSVIVSPEIAIQYYFFKYAEGIL